MEAKTELDYEIVENRGRVTWRSRSLIIPNNYPSTSNEVQRFFQACRHLSQIVLEDFNKDLVPSKGSLNLLVFDKGFSYEYN